MASKGPLIPVYKLITPTPGWHAQHNLTLDEAANEVLSLKFINLMKFHGLSRCDLMLTGDCQATSNETLSALNLQAERLKQLSVTLMHHNASYVVYWTLLLGAWPRY
jgi:hypothetical protein